MPPPKRVPPRLVAKLTEAAAAYAASKEARTAAIMEALRAGASPREIAKHVGLTHEQVRRIGLANGWPDAKEAARRAEEAERHAEFWRNFGGKPDGPIRH